MANVFLSIPVPTGNGIGASVDISGLGWIKTLVLSGSLEGCLNVEMSQDNVNWGPVTTFYSSQDDLKISFAAMWVRARVTGYVRGASVLSIGADVDTVTLLSLPVPAGNGIGASVDVSAMGQSKTLFYSGGRNVDVNCIVEISTDGVVFSQLASFQGATPATLNIISSIQTMRIRTNGFVMGAPVMFVSSVPNTGAAAPQPELVEVTAPQTLISGEVRVVPHTLGVVPDIVTPQNGSPIVVTARSATDITIQNPDTSPHTATFYIIRESPLTRSSVFTAQPYLWQGIDTQAVTGAETSLNVKTYGALGNGVHDDTPNIQNCINAAITLGIANVFFPPGNYKMTKQGTSGFPYAILLNSTKKVRLWGVPGSILTYPSSNLVHPGTFCNAFLLDSLTNVIFEGIELVGDVDSDLVTNIGYGVQTTSTAVSQVVIRNCRFTNVGPVQATSNAGSFYYVFEHNWVFEAPNAVVTGFRGKIENNYFIYATVTPASSHSVYLYGAWDQATINGNHFINVASYCMKLKGNSGVFERKIGFVVSHNYNNVSQGFCEIGSESEVSHMYVSTTGNVVVNSQAGIKVFAGYGASVTGNTVATDWQASATLNCIGILVQSSGIATTAGDCAHSHTTDVGNNTVIADANFVGILQFSGQPSVGDQVVVAAVTYTFVAGAPTTTSEVQIGASAAVTAVNLCDKIQGRNTYANLFAMNDILWEPKRAFCSATNQTPTQVVINGMTTFTLSTTSLNIAIVQAPTDYAQQMQFGIRALHCIGGINIHDNHLFECRQAIFVGSCVAPIIRQNTAYGCKTTSANPQVFQGLGNAFPIWENNSFRISPDSVEASPGRRFEIDDGFPVIRGNYGMDALSSGFMCRELGGAGGLISAQSDGKAQAVMYYGYEFLGASVAFPQNELVRWNDGDTVVLNDNAGHVYTFTFKRTAPNAGALEFNTRVTDDGTHVSLIGLINTTAEFIATSPIRWNGTLNANEYSYVMIKRTTAGTAGNGATITVTSRSQLTGLLLGNTQRTGTGTSLRKVRTVNFLGGAATAGTQTVIWSPLAGQVLAPQIIGANQGWATLELSTAGGVTGKYFSSATSGAAAQVAGVGWVLTHPTAAGTELFWYSVV